MKLILSAIFLVAIFFAAMILALAEISIISLNKDELDEAAINSKTAARIAEMAARPNHYLFAMRIIGAIFWLIFGAVATNMLIYPLYYRLLAPRGYGQLLAPALVVVLVIIAICMLIINEIAKARIGIKNPRSAMFVLIHFLRPLLWIARPLAGCINAITNFFLRPLGIGINYREKSATREEIMNMVSQSGKRGSIDAADAEMITNIFEFDEKTAQNIGCHRTEIVAIDISASREEIINTIIESEFSRIPVYEGNIDSIIGILHSKDLMSQALAAKERRWEINLHALMREAYAVPTSAKTTKLLEHMRQKQTHMAIVVDEYGGVTGLLTVEDLLEEIVGSIYDEYDDVDEPQIDKLSEGRYIIEGTTNLEEIAEQLDITLPIDDYETIGGFLTAQIGRIPADGEQPSIVYAGYEFRIYDARDKRIHSIWVSKVDDEKES